MFEQRDPTGRNFVTYELDANDFEFFPGETLAPGEEIGIDIRSGSPVYLDCQGKVATAYYNPMNHSYLVMISCLGNNNLPSHDSNDKQFAIA